MERGGGRSAGGGGEGGRGDSGASPLKSQRNFAIYLFVIQHHTFRFSSFSRGFYPETYSKYRDLTPEASRVKCLSQGQHWPIKPASF